MNKITAVFNVMLVVALVLGSVGVAVAESQKVIVSEELVWSEYSGIISSLGERVYRYTYSDGTFEFVAIRNKLSPLQISEKAPVRQPDGSYYIEITITPWSLFPCTKYKVETTLDGNVVDPLSGLAWEVCGTTSSLIMPVYVTPPSTPGVYNYRFQEYMLTSMYDPNAYWVRGDTHSVTITVGNPVTATATATPAQTTPPPPASTGTILIWSNPAGAQVTIDSANAGTTSANWLQVSKPPGTYQVSIQMSGYTPFTQSVSVTSGQYSTVQATLTAVGTPTPTPTPPPPTPGQTPPSQNCGAGQIFSTTYGKCVPNKAPESTQPATTLSQIIQGIANWLVTWLKALAISGPDTVSLGAGTQTFSISTTASEQPKSDYNDGTYSELWGTWMVVDSNQNIIAQRNPTWVKLTSGTFTDTATATFNNKGSYAVVDVIIKVPYTYTNGAWVKGAETIVGKDQQAVKVAIPSPASQAATSGAGSPPQTSLTSWLKSMWSGLISWLFG